MSDEKKPVFRVELSLPQAKSLITSFKEDRRKALVKLTHELRKQAESAVNSLLSSEFDLFLAESGAEPAARNGYKHREYFLKGIGGLRVSIPRDRSGDFQSAIIPAHERMDPRLREDIAILQLAGLSNRTMSLVSKRMFGLQISKDLVNDSLGLIKEEALKWLERPIDNEAYWALFVDGTNFKIRRKDGVAKEPSLVVLGLTKDNYRSIIAIEPGWKESKDAWREAFKTLKRRGLDGSKVRLGVMDGLPGLESVFKEEFPNAVTQRCWVHAKRNAVLKCPKRLQAVFSGLLNNIMYAGSEDEAMQAFEQFTATMKPEAERAVRVIEKDLTSLLSFLKFPKTMWHTLRTTNSIERVNKELKRRIKSMETVTDKAHTPLLAFTALRLEMGWRKRAVDSSQEIAFAKVAQDRAMLQLTTNQPELNSIESVVDELGLMN